MASPGLSSVVRTVRPNSTLRKTVGLSTRVQLETVLGLTVVSNAQLAFNPGNGLVAYTAGCVVVIWDPTTDSQQHFIVPNKRTLSALGYSHDGRLLASGECGQVPCIRVWDTRDGSQICELTGHKNGITFVAFSPDTKLLISVGTHHDNLIVVWDWRNGRMIATNKVTCKVKGIAFAEDGSYFVSVGNRHVKYWYLDPGMDSRGVVIPLVGRSAVLGDYKDEYFLDVVCGRGGCAEYAYAATQSGYLCQFNSRRSLEKMISLKSSAANCLSATETTIVAGSSNGNVRLYNPVTLNQMRILPHPHHTGVDVAQFTSTEQLQMRSHNNLVFPDCVALTCDDIRGRITVVYNDHSIYVWDIRDRQTSKICSHMFHSRCVWGLDIFAPSHPHPASAFLAGTFITCSSDDTIRIWNTVNKPRDIASSNLFCSATFKILYNDVSHQFLCNRESSPGGVDPQDVHTDSRYGIRCVRIDPTGLNIAFGDRTGNIHIYETKSMHESYKIEAHDSEVLCLEYSNPESGYEFLASASRDRLIQIFDVKNDYDCIQTLDDHSSSITALRFASLNGARQFGLISCGVDKAVILRTVQYSKENGPKLMLNDQILSKGGIVYDMDIDRSTQSIVTANQDRNIRLYGIKSRKLEKTVKGSATDEGALIKLDLHTSGRYIATSCSDKNLAIIDVVSGDCWASFSGHSEIVTGLRFDQENKRLISVSGDGCLFVWKIGGELTAAGAKLPDIVERGHIPLSPSHSTQSEFSISGSETQDEAYPTPLRPGTLSFDDSPLPSWAKSKSLPSPSVDVVVTKPSGKWADKEDRNEVFATRSPLPVSLNDIDGSLLGISSGGVAWVDLSPNPISPSTPALHPLPIRSRSSTSTSTSSSLSDSRRTLRQGLSLTGSTSPLTAESQKNEPKIFGILGGPRKKYDDELEDDDDDVTQRTPVRPVVDQSVPRSVPDAYRGQDVFEDVDFESLSNVSTTSKGSSPVPSRPETPSEAANKFLNLNTAAIDKAFKSRLQHRQSVTIKHGPLPAAAVQSVLEPATTQKSASFASPSQKLIHNVKLSQSRQKYKSTQNLSTPPITARLSDFGRGSQHGSNQDTDQPIRRATSMTSLQDDSTRREGLDGYNSLLERAKARLSATKTRSDFGSLSSLSGCKTDRSSLSATKSRTGVGNGDGLSMSSDSPHHSPVLNQMRSVRSGSSERNTTRRLPEQPSSEIKNSLPKALLDRRTRRNSATRFVEPVTSVLLSSPTTSAIARIKAELGLAADSSSLNNPGDGSATQNRSVVARGNCELLSSSADKFIMSLTEVLNSEEDDVMVSMFKETLQSVRTKLNSALVVIEETFPKPETNGSTNGQGDNAQDLLLDL